MHNYYYVSNKTEAMDVSESSLYVWYMSMFLKHTNKCISDDVIIELLSNMSLLIHIFFSTFVTLSSSDIHSSITVMNGE